MAVQEETQEERPGLSAIEQYRIDELERMGFTSWEAKKLALIKRPTNDYSNIGGYEVDLEKVRKMLEGGASHKQVMRILS